MALSPIMPESVKFVRQQITEKGTDGDLEPALSFSLGFGSIATHETHLSHERSSTTKETVRRELDD